MFELLAVMILLAFLLAWRWRRRESAWMPRELRRAELAYAEKLFKARGPVTLTAKVDRAYRRRDGVIVLVELKTRRGHRHYPSDVIELSAQRGAIMKETGETVALRAYVLVQDLSRRRTVHRVDLLDEGQVDTLIERREAILSGRLQPERANSAKLCQTCVYKDRCL
ncbi:MAG: PD-(D/E)XK nuclease family protein [Azoarcus sp.]|nr:PD-(D/E)XK nuclease family protein [Azoarcus sp.]